MPSSPGGFPTSRRPSGAALVSRDRSREWLPAPFPSSLMGPPPLPSPGDRPPLPLPPGGQPGPSIGFPNTCPGRSCRGHAWFCRRDSTRPQNASGLTPIPPRNGFPAFLPSSPHVDLSRAFLSGKPGDRRDGPSGSGLRPHRRGVPSGRSLPAPIRRPGRFPETPGPRKTGRAFGGAGGLGVPGPGTGGRPEDAAFAPCGHRLSPQAGGPAAVRRSLPRRPKPSRDFIPAGDAGRRAAARSRLAGACPKRTGPLRSFDPLPPHVGLSRLLREAWMARGRLPPASPSRRRFPSSALRGDPGKPRLSPGRPAACSWTLQSGKSQRRSRIC
jgi:hypothetical protein